MGIFKAYDIRGIYPTELDEAKAERIGAAFARLLGARRVAVGRDVRASAPSVGAALIRGIVSTGCAVIDLGLCDTPAVYFAVGHLGLDGGVMTTASHNPPQYIGFKMCRAQAVPISETTGIRDIEQAVAKPPLSPVAAGGTVESADLKTAYRDHIRRFLVRPRALHLVVDAASGGVGPIFDAVFEGYHGKITRLFFEPDGSFPHHEPNPLKDENVEALVRTVREQKGDLGIAFDGDADRCIFFDESGQRIPSDLMNAFLARHALREHPGSAVVHDLRSSRVVREEVERAGGRAIRERVGHSFIKDTMRREKAILGGEVAGHYYFRDNYFADSGMIALCAALSAISDEGKPASQCIAPLRRYPATGEVNFHVEDKDRVLQELMKRFSDGHIDQLDGVTVEYPTWWFNVRKSNTEPLLRLNMEANTAAVLEEARRRVVETIGGTPE